MDFPYWCECMCVRVIYLLFSIVLFVFICFITAKIRAISLAVYRFNKGFTYLLTVIRCANVTLRVLVAYG